MESDVRYYRRRACEEMAAAARSITPAARERRLQLVDLYLDKLRDMDAPLPFESAGPAFTWSSQPREAQNA